MEINFCPFCSAGVNKIMVLNDSLYCKECERFFYADQKKYTCHACNKGRMEVSDFPMPNGEIILQCRSCKKLVSLKEYFKKESLE